MLVEMFVMSSKGEGRSCRVVVVVVVVRKWFDHLEKMCESEMKIKMY